MAFTKGQRVALMVDPLKLGRIRLVTGGLGRPKRYHLDMDDGSTRASLQAAQLRAVEESELRAGVIANAINAICPRFRVGERVQWRPEKRDTIRHYPYNPDTPQMRGKIIAVDDVTHELFVRRDAPRYVDGVPVATFALHPARAEKLPRMKVGDRVRVTNGHGPSAGMPFGKVLAIFIVNAAPHAWVLWEGGAGGTSALPLDLLEVVCYAEDNT